MRPALVLVALLSVSISRGAHGQRLTDALIGSAVRLDTEDGSLVTGTLVGVDADMARSRFRLVECRGHCVASQFGIGSSSSESS